MANVDARTKRERPLKMGNACVNKMKIRILTTTNRWIMTKIQASMECASVVLSLLELMTSVIYSSQKKLSVLKI